jgi:hypothetical protein
VAFVFELIVGAAADNFAFQAAQGVVIDDFA